eukprot:CAMPEP_0182441160 /NCGR_PEP_ID=MMETSP1172-20130603/114_1 /TAXON_ID=708627 /ORGANISM="Timspurckia oligopyrenoides, Strain CCMP3278" /LENGTH=262 /DNA_ID=CAMNT_0024635323 /DNA_START=129 /DNA_END=917 /DNA_ORIENTATION=-
MFVSPLSAELFKAEQPRALHIRHSLRDRHTPVFTRRKSSVQCAVAESDESAPSADGYLNRTSLDQFSVGQEVQGRVGKVVDFGAWIDVGAERSGLLHIRDMSDSFVYDTSSMLSKGDTITVRVKYSDPVNKKLAFTLLERKINDSLKPLSEFSVGQEIEGTVLRITNYGAYLDAETEVDAFLHVSKLWGRRPRETLERLQIGQSIRVSVVSVGPGKKLEVGARSRYEESSFDPFITESLSDALERPPTGGEDYDTSQNEEYS